MASVCHTRLLPCAPDDLRAAVLREEAVVHDRELLIAVSKGEQNGILRPLMRPIKAIPENKKIDELMREMQSDKFHMAIVVDEYGGTAGLVTLEDLLEEIVGEITDEYDVEEPRVEKLPNGTLRVPGRTPIDEVNEELDVHLPDDEWDTVGGLVFFTLGHVPEEGECVTVDGLEFCADRVQGTRIVSVLISPAPSSGFSSLTGSSRS